MCRRESILRLSRLSAPLIQNCLFLMLHCEEKNTNKTIQLIVLSVRCIPEVEYFISVHLE